MANTIVSDGQVLFSAAYNQNPTILNNFFNAPDTGNPALSASTLASAATISIPSTGVYFTITGTTSITELSGGTLGRFIILRFAGILTLTNGNHINIGANVVTTANTVVGLVSDSGGNFTLAFKNGL